MIHVWAALPSLKDKRGISGCRQRAYLHILVCRQYPHCNDTKLVKKIGKVSFNGSLFMIKCIELKQTGDVNHMYLLLLCSVWNFFQNPSGLTVLFRKMLSPVYLSWTAPLQLSKASLWVAAWCKLVSLSLSINAATQKQSSALPCSCWKAVNIYDLKHSFHFTKDRSFMFPLERWT